jgi:ribosomal-protein-serine acetyltransferase
MAFVLETRVPGLAMRQLEQQHAAELFALIDQERGQLSLWLPWPEHTKSVRDTEAFIAVSAVEWQIRQRLACALWLGPRIIGGIGIVETDAAAGMAELGYWLAADYQGHGYMTAAVCALSRYCLLDLRWTEVLIRTLEGNAASRAVAERAGYELATVSDDRVLYRLTALGVSEGSGS